MWGLQGSSHRPGQTPARTKPLESSRGWGSFGVGWSVLCDSGQSEQPLWAADGIITSSWGYTGGLTSSPWLSIAPSAGGGTPRRKYCVMGRTTRGWPASPRPGPRAHGSAATAGQRNQRCWGRKETFWPKREERKESEKVEEKPRTQLRCGPRGRRCCPPARYGEEAEVWPWVLSWGRSQRGLSPAESSPLLLPRG